MPLVVVLPLIAGGVGFAGWGIGFAADKTARLVNGLVLAGVVYVGGKALKVF